MYHLNGATSFVLVNDCIRICCKFVLGSNALRSIEEFIVRDILDLLYTSCRQWP